MIVSITGLACDLVYLIRSGKFPGRDGTKGTRDGTGQDTPGNPGNGTPDLNCFLQNSRVQTHFHCSQHSMGDCEKLNHFNVYSQLTKLGIFSHPRLLISRILQSLTEECEMEAEIWPKCLSRFPSRPGPGQALFVPFPGKYFSGKSIKYNKYP